MGVALTAGGGAPAYISNRHPQFSVFVELAAHPSRGRLASASAKTRKPFASFFNLRYVAALASSLSLSALPTALQAFALYLFEVTVSRL